jgi:hypothetical protein
MQEDRVLEYDGREFLMPYIDLVPGHTDDELARLRESIRMHGVLKGIQVTPDDVVVNGHTRLRIARELGIPLANVPFEELQVGTEAAMLLAVQLNTVPAIGRQWTRERRIVMAHRLRKRNWTLAKIAEAMGFSKSQVHNYLKEPDPEDDGSAPDLIEGADGKKRRAKYQPRPHHDDDPTPQPNFPLSGKLGDSDDAEPAQAEGDGHQDHDCPGPAAEQDAAPEPAWAEGFGREAEADTGSGAAYDGAALPSSPVANAADDAATPNDGAAPAPAVDPKPRGEDQNVLRTEAVRALRMALWSAWRMGILGQVEGYLRAAYATVGPMVEDAPRYHKEFENAIQMAAAKASKIDRAVYAKAQPHLQAAFDIVHGTGPGAPPTPADPAPADSRADREVLWL